MTTAARVHTERKDASWYTTKGEPIYEIPKADGKGTRAPTLADAKKRGDLLPRVTTILNQLDKPALNDWKVEQGVLAVLTTPRQPGEADDAFVHRVLHVERVQDQEAASARDKGTAIHGALQAYFNGEEVPADMRPWIMPAAQAVAARGERVASEKVLVGNGYAGRTDLILEAPDHFLILDFKTTKKLPEKGSWFEHVLQLAAYAAAFHSLMVEAATTAGECKAIRTANVYISTIEQGKFVVWENEPDWSRAYLQAFQSLVSLWQYQTNYQPAQ